MGIGWFPSAFNPHRSGESSEATTAKVMKCWSAGSGQNSIKRHHRHCNDVSIYSGVCEFGNAWSMNAYDSEVNPFPLIQY